MTGKIKKILKYRIRSRYALGIIFMVAFLAGEYIWIYSDTIQFPSEVQTIIRKIKKLQLFEKIERPNPNPVSMSRLKKQGCVTDGLLSEYNPENNKFVELINRSNCYYLHRAIETWLKPPDFETVNYVMNQITKKDVVYGMFIAEAINTRAEYYNYYENSYFDFKSMCRNGSEDAWGPHSCKPNFSSGEYQNYIKYTTEKAMDLGVQSFMFGQIYMQEGGEKDYAAKIIKKMRAYAKKKDIDIVIGAQTGAISEPDYLALFDYIEGGVGIDANGNIEDGPCLSSRSSCWALLWHKNFSEKAKNVLLHLDWSGIPTDDLDIFARMTKEERVETLKNLYTNFTSKNMGFLMPFFGVLDKNNGGCYGPKKRFYSPDMEYSCQDEKVINDILAGKR
jgi:hypothetical protein